MVVREFLRIKFPRIVVDPGAEGYIQCPECELMDIIPLENPIYSGAISDDESIDKIDWHDNRLKHSVKVWNCKVVWECRGRRFTLMGNMNDPERKKLLKQGSVR